MGNIDNDKNVQVYMHTFGVRNIGGATLPFSSFYLPGREVK